MKLFNPLSRKKESFEPNLPGKATMFTSGPTASGRLHPGEYRRFVFADLLNVHINDVGEMSLDVDEEPPPVSSTCVVFAKSEGAGLLRQGWPKEKVLAAYCSAMAHRIVTLLERIGVEKEFAITGGIAKNVGIVKRVAQELGVEPLQTETDTQLAGAAGAALFARALHLKEMKKK